MSFHCFCKRRAQSEGWARAKNEPKVTYTLIPGVPEFVESLVETDGESEGGSEDACDEDTWQGRREFSGLHKVVGGSVVLFRRAMVL